MPESKNVTLSKVEILILYILCLLFGIPIAFAASQLFFRNIHPGIAMSSVYIVVFIIATISFAWVLKKKKLRES